jgi:hypothetical protein
MSRGKAGAMNLRSFLPIVTVAMVAACSTPDAAEGAGAEEALTSTAPLAAPHFDGHCTVNQDNASDIAFDVHLAGGAGGDNTFDNRGFDVGDYRYMLQAAHLTDGRTHQIHFVFSQFSAAPVDPNAFGGAAENQDATVGSSLHFVAFRGGFHVECSGSLNP